MLPVFKNLSSLSKKFTTKKPMPKDFQDKLKGLLDTAEDKLKNKHKVTPAELYSYTTAYHIYFLIDGDKKSEVPYHYDEKVYGIPKTPILGYKGKKSMEGPKRTSSVSRKKSKSSGVFPSSSKKSSSKGSVSSTKKKKGKSKSPKSPKLLRSIRMPTTRRPSIKAGGARAYSDESMMTEAGGEDSQNIIINPENALVPYSDGSSQASSLASSIVSELRDTNDREGSRYLVRLLQHIANATDSGITITFNNIETVYNRYISSGVRGAAAMTAGLASFAVLRLQRAYRGGRAALLDVWDGGVNAITWIGDYISGLYGLGHHLFQNFWRDFRATDLNGQYHMVKRLIEVIVPFRRGWVALSGLLGASLPAIQVLVSNFASYVITNVHSLFSWLVSSPGWISLQTLTCLTDLWYAAIDLLLGTDLVLNSNYAALTLVASIGLLYIIQYARRGIRERGIDFREMLTNAMDRVEYRRDSARRAFIAKMNEITASREWGLIWGVGVDLQDKLRALDDILTSLVAAPIAGGLHTGIFLAAIFRQCTNWFKRNVEECYEEGVRVRRNRR